MTQNEFNAHWTIEEMPACEIGMKLLKIWADLDPLVLPRLRHDPAMTGPISFLSPAGEAFMAHRSTCPDCNEV